MSNDEIVVGLNDVHKIYPTSKGPLHAVRGVNLVCRSGEILSVLGPSGSGKSSLMRMIAGLEQASAGEVTIGGQRVNEVPPQRRNVSLAFENYALYPAMTVRQNLGFPLKNLKNYDRQAINARVQEIVEYLNLVDVANSKPAELSGGHRQMVSLGRALIKPADVHILDEPLSHLDLQFRNEVVAKLKSLQQEHGLTMILITHDQEEALELADRVIVLNDGLLQQLGTPADIVMRPANLFVADFVGEPPMNFIPCRFEGSSSAPLVTETGVVIGLPEGARISENANNLLLGVRPSELFFADDGEMEHVFESPVQFVRTEQLGEISILTVDLKGQLLTVVQRRRDARDLSGDQCRLGYRPTALHLFDLETGHRLNSFDEAMSRNSD